MRASLDILTWKIELDFPRDWSAWKKQKKSPSARTAKEMFWRD